MKFQLTQPLHTDNARENNIRINMFNQTTWRSKSVDCATFMKTNFITVEKGQAGVDDQ